MKPVEIRSELVDALQLDLVGPDERIGSPDELLPQAPSRWYLTGFIVPADADEQQRSDPDGDEDIEVVDEDGADDDVTPEPAAARRTYFPSSVGLTVLIPEDTRELTVTVHWGDYKYSESGDSGVEKWQRLQRAEKVVVSVPGSASAMENVKVPGSAGLKIEWSIRPVTDLLVEGGIPANARCVSLFLVNRRAPADEELRDESFAFQAQFTVRCKEGFVPRPNLRNATSAEWDERVADLQYRDSFEFAVGHNIATHAEHVGEVCHTVRTCWIPKADVERVDPVELGDVELSMDTLGSLENAAVAQEKLGALVSQYRAWIEQQSRVSTYLSSARADTTAELLNRANVAASRIQEGIALLEDVDCLKAFSIANRAMASAAKQRLGVMQGGSTETVRPKWRTFQLAFILMNMSGIAIPEEADREVVDLLFFPTGGGKTEAYLGLAAFTIVLRRLRNPGFQSSGLSVLMRYTLRLLTFDQLGRAATLICALEIERQNDVATLGDWPFEIGLWVGRAATPNRMGAINDGDGESARARTIAYKNDDRKPLPIPLEECPWCGTKFGTASFNLVTDERNPKDLRITCINRNCRFSRNNHLPILAVDDSIYRRLPCLMIATVDKFAAMPWTGEVGSFFGSVQRHDKDGFYGPCSTSFGDPLPFDSLPPPDLIIQDELHLISGPLGTMVGLYEAALDELCTVTRSDGRRVRPKIVASTATVRRAEEQIKAIFDRRTVDIFPPLGPDRRDSFFARTEPTTVSNARLYLGIAAQGRSPKIVMLRVYLALLASGQKCYNDVGKKPTPDNSADPYMTLLGYFNSLRELGGARRLIEDEVRNRLSGYQARRRINETAGMFSNRTIAYEPVELTSRVSTSKVSEAKRRLTKPYSDEARVDVAIATNMISVGLDITRLGLMVVFGQPKSAAEYIQSTSRVGRDRNRPGLVVTILNNNKPRDRSHYERFTVFHESFYRSVEATSVTPFSPRALDRGLAGTLVALARHTLSSMTPPLGAGKILIERDQLGVLAERMSERARSCCSSETPPNEVSRTGQRVQERSIDLLDAWSKLAAELSLTGTGLQYQREVGAAQRLLYAFLSPEVKNLPASNVRMKFRANRSMRDVEPNVNLWMKTLAGVDLEEADE